MHPTSKQSPKRSPAQRLKRQIRKMFTKRSSKPASLPRAPDAPVVRLPGATVEALSVACAGEKHLVHVVRIGHTTKAIITPCGIRATMAAYKLGADTCGRAIELLQNRLNNRSEPWWQTSASTDEHGLILHAIGDGEALQAHNELRRQRRNRAATGGDGWAAERHALTMLVLPKLVQRAAGADAKVTFDGRRVYIELPGQEVPSCCVYDTGTWGVGPGPQAPPAVYAALNRWAKVILTTGGAGPPTARARR